MDDEGIDTSSLLGIIEVPPHPSGRNQRRRWLELVASHEMLVVPAARQVINPFTRTKVAYPALGTAEIVIHSRRVGQMLWFDGNQKTDSDEIHVHSDLPELVLLIAHDIAEQVGGTFRHADDLR